ncbi:unnamed protein product, partial [Hapterophycus canaliculatus]
PAVSPVVLKRKKKRAFTIKPSTAMSVRKEGGRRTSETWRGEACFCFRSPRVLAAAIIDVSCLVSGVSLPSCVPRAPPISAPATSGHHDPCNRKPRWCLPFFTKHARRAGGAGKEECGGWVKV